MYVLAPREEVLSEAVLPELAMRQLAEERVRWQALVMRKLAEERVREQVIDLVAV